MACKIRRLNSAVRSIRNREWSEPPIREFVPVIVDQGQEWLDFVPPGPFADLICLLVPPDESHLFEFREMPVDDFDFTSLWLDLIGDNVQWISVVIILRIVIQQRNKQLAPVGVRQRLKYSI